MKFLVLGSGLMGPAAAHNALRDPDVALVTLADKSSEQLDSARALLERENAGERLSFETLELEDKAASVALFNKYDVILAALPWSASVFAFDAALAAGVPIVDLAIPDDGDVVHLRKQTSAVNGLIVLGAGLEPGLTEILARHLATKFDTVTDLHIQCGGVPEFPSGPLGYKIVFGGKALPLRDIDALVVHECQPQLAARYSEAESTDFTGVGTFEAWHEGVLPWILDLPEFGHLHSASQKTIRWPGYSEKATTLLNLGLLGTTPISVNGVKVRPKDVVDAVLFPHVKLGDDENDITLFRVEVTGEKDGRRTIWRADMVDHKDRERGFTSMARTTAFTGAIVARMIGRGDISEHGLFTSEQLITGQLYDRLIAELAEEGIAFQIVEGSASGRE